MVCFLSKLHSHFGRKVGTQGVPMAHAGWVCQCESGATGAVACNYRNERLWVGFSCGVMHFSELIRKPMTRTRGMQGLG